jgi:hypothetical protein
MLRQASRVLRASCTFLLLAGVFLTLGLSAARAQCGPGTALGTTGTTQSQVSLSGTITEVRKRPCPQATGRSSSRTHLMLDTSAGPVNLRLGPTAALRDLRAATTHGTAASAQAVRLGSGPSAKYVALRVSVADTTYRLRDPDTLRPRWRRGRSAGGVGCRGRRGRHFHPHHRHRGRTGCRAGGGCP